MMTVRRGQVALYLVLVLVALTFLFLMNVGAYLGVSARNKTMNAGDAAALAVAHRQGELLNEVGEMNVRHLKAALDGDAETCAEIAEAQVRTVFLGPLDGIQLGNEAAKKNGAESDAGMAEILKRHVSDIRLYYETNPDAYPEPWEGAWEEYAKTLEAAIATGIWAGPDNIDFMDGADDHFLLNPAFYEAIAGRNWCWFFFNTAGLLDTYSSFRDWAPLPAADAETREARAYNSEVYSLNLRRVRGAAVDLLGTNVIRRLTGATEAEIAASPLLADCAQAWFFYDTNGFWRAWREISVDAGFPVMGAVRPEYDVLGAAAVCRATRTFSTLVRDATTKTSVWSAAAKCFGTLEGEDGDLACVTALRGFVAGGFTDVRLVPLDAVGGSDLSTADPDWMTHVHDHLGPYLLSGPGLFPSCWYCQQLVDWEKPNLRSTGSRWLKHHSSSCSRPSSGGSGGRGGSAHGH